MTPVQFITRCLYMLFSIAGITILIIWIYKFRNKALYAVAPLSWLVNVLVFSMARMLNLPTDVLIVNLWSAIIVLHALILIIGGTLIFWPGRKDVEQND